MTDAKSKAQFHTFISLKYFHSQNHMVKHYPWYDCNVGIKVPFEQCDISANDTTVKDVKKEIQNF